MKSFSSLLSVDFSSVENATRAAVLGSSAIANQSEPCQIRDERKRRSGSPMVQGGAPFVYGGPPFSLVEKTSSSCVGSLFSLCENCDLTLFIKKASGHTATQSATARLNATDTGFINKPLGSDPIKHSLSMNRMMGTVRCVPTESKAFIRRATLLMGAIAFLVGAVSQTAHALEADTLNVHKMEGIVVVANSEETPLREIGSSVTVITFEEIQLSQKQSVSEVLRTVPGLDVVQTGARGGQTSVFMRGANSGHTLVLVDGIEMNDPSSPNGAFDFADLSVDDIERIEVLRGSQSILYGSDAIGGVISIITRKGAGEPRTTLSANYGAYSTSKLAANTSGSTLRASYSFSASRTDSKGFSATELAPINERDGFGLTTLSGKLVVRPNEFAQLRLVAKSSESETELDKSFSNFDNRGVFDDLNYRQNSRKSFLKGEVDVLSHNSFWRAKASATLANNGRTTSDSPDPVFGSGFESTEYDVETERFIFKGIATPFAKQRFIVGLETERDLLSQVTDFGFGLSSLNGERARTTGVYGLAQLSAGDRVFVTLGVRNDNHDRFEHHTSFRATGSIVVPGVNTRLKASFGDGFNAPTLFQLFDSTFGNTALKPEESESWDVGFEQRMIDGRITLGATWFHQSIKNIFGSDASFRTINIASARTEGAEIFAERRSNHFIGRVDYTYTDAINRANGSSLLRRAKSKVALRVNYERAGLGSFGFQVRHVGSRADNDFERFPALSVSLKDYTVFRLTAQREVFEAVTITGRIENLFDKRYQEVLRYATSGRSAYFGVRYEL